MIAQPLLIAWTTLLGSFLTDTPTPKIPTRCPTPSERTLFAFNGKDCAGFSTFLRYQKKQDPHHVFRVVDGCLLISGEEFGGITTNRSFANYHLVAEWRWGGGTWYPRQFHARNSGILVHCTGAEGDGLGAWMAGLETQLIEGGCGDLILVPGKTNPSLQIEAEVRVGADGQCYYQPGGQLSTRGKGRLNWLGRDPDWRDVAWFRGAHDPAHPVGSWNRSDIICDGDRVTCYLNGELVNSARVLGTAAGRVMLQSEGAAISFRKLELHALPTVPH